MKHSLLRALAPLALLIFAPTVFSQTPLLCGVTQTNSIAGVGERDTYSYTAAAGEIVSLRMTALTTGLDAQIELRDGSSNLIASALNKLDRTLTNPGTYLIIALDQGNNEAGDYALALQRLANPCNATPLNCPETRTNSISTIGEIDAYTVVVPAGGAFTTFRPESLTTGFTANLEVFDPLGRAVGSSSSTLTLNLTNAGNYTLLISHSSGASRTGDYRLATQRIVGPCAASALDCGQVGAGDLGVVGELDAFTIAAAGGEAVSLQLLSTNTLFPAVFDLYTPAGTLVTSGDTDFVGVLANAGLYTVLVRASSGTTRTGNYWLGLERVVNPCDALPLGCGSLMTNTLGTLRETDAYTISGNQVVTLRLEGISANFLPTMRLYNPAGQLILNSATITTNLADAGSYTLLVSHNSGSSRTGDYRVSAQRVVAPCNAVAIACGAVAAGALVATGELDAFTFTVTDSGPYLVEVSSTNTSIRLEIFDPTGRLAAPAGASFTGLLTNAGPHVVIVSVASGTRTGNYGLSVERTKDACGSTALPCGSLASNSIGELGEADAYTFDVPPGGAWTLLKLESGSANFTPEMKLYNPAGVLVQTSASTILSNLATAGTYTLIVGHFSGSSRTGDYRLAHQRIVGGCNAASFGCGDLVAGQLAVAGELGAFTLNATGGEWVTLRLTSTNAQFNPRFDMYDPNGRLVNSSSGTLFTSTLTNAGPHTLLVSYASGTTRTGNYWLAFEKVVGACNPVALVCGGVTNGSLAVIGELDVFSFNATAGQIATLKLSTLSAGFFPALEVYDPAGRALAVTGGSTRFGGVLTNAGVYTVVVRYGSGSTRVGDYTLFSQNLTSPCGSSGVLACGGSVSGLLPPGSLAQYQFAGTAGQIVSLRLSTTGTPVQDWEVYEPDGTLVTISDTTLTRTLTKSGNYLVLVFPPAGTPQISDFTLSLNTVRQPCAAVPLVCGALQAGALTEIGEIHVFTFIGASNEVVRLRLESVTEFFTAVFDLNDPDGILLSTGSGYDEYTPLLTKAGEYTVLVRWPEGADSRFGEYRLGFHRVSAPCATTPLLLDTTTTANFANAGETDLYHFTAGPGLVTVCLNGRPDGPFPTMQLYHANGLPITSKQSSPLFSNLASNGTYRLLVQDEANHLGPYFIRVASGSNDCFSLDMDLPSVEVRQPQAGAFVTRGANTTVSWTSSDSSAIARHEIWLSQNGGLTYSALATNLPGNNLTYDWAVPAGVSAGGWRMRIVAVDAAGRSGAGETEGNFFAVNSAQLRTSLYGYDVLNQLVFFNDPAGQAQMYAYDPSLNRTQNLVITDPNSDSDGDGIPDLWELTHGFDPLTTADGAADADADGMSNYQEYVACTDPFNAFSVLRITGVTPEPSETRLVFRSRPGRTYAVEWTTNLSAAIWSPLPAVTAGFTSTSVTNTAGLGASAQFYRVRIQPGTPCD